MRAVKKSLPVLFLLLFALAFLWDAAFFRKAFFYFDIVGFNLPLRQFLGERLAEGIFPLWCAQKFCGFPVFAEGQGGFLYPPNLLLFPLMAAWKAFNLSMVLNFFLGSCFMYAYLRRSLPVFSSLTGSVAFAYGGYFLCHSIHTAQINVAIWLPLLFFFADSALEGGGFRSVLAGAAVCAIMIVAGHTHACMISLTGLFLYLLLRGVLSGRPRGVAVCLLVLALVVLLGAGLGAVQLLPMAELTRHSARFQALPYGFLVQGSYSPAFFATLLVPDLFGNRGSDTVWFNPAFPYHEMDIYIGVLPLVFLVVMMTNARDRRSLAWLALWATSIVLMLGKYTPFYHVFSWLPYFDRMRLPSKYALLFAFTSCVMLARGTEIVFCGRGFRLAPALTGLLVLLVFVAGVYCVAYDGIFWKAVRADGAVPERLARLGSLISSDTKRALVLVIAGIAILVSARRVPRAGKALAALSLVTVLADLAVFSRSRLPLIDPCIYADTPPTLAALERDESIFRVFSDDIFSGFSYAAPGWRDDTRQYYYALYTLPYDTQMLFGLQSIRGGSPLALRRMERLVSGERRRMIDMLNGRYILTWGKLDGQGLEPLYTAGPRVYLNRRAMERAFAVPRALFARSGEEALAMISRDDFVPREAVVLEGADPEDFQCGGAGGRGLGAEARIISYSDHDVIVDVEMPCNGFLVLSDTYYPGWRAEVDGLETPIYRANYVVRAVYLEKGGHRVNFRYRPASLTHGLAVSAAFCAVLVVLCLAGRRMSPGWLAVPFAKAEVGRGARFLVLVVLAALVLLSLFLEPGNWRGAFPFLRIP